MTYAESTDLTPRASPVDLESSLVTYLPLWLAGTTGPDATPYGSVWVSSSVPNPRPPTFLHVWRAGGPLARPLVYVQTFASNDDTRVDLAGRVHVALLSAAGKVPRVLSTVDESYPTEVLDSTGEPVMFGSVSFVLTPF